MAVNPTITSFSKTNVSDAFTKHVDFVQCIIYMIAKTRSIKDEFQQYLLAEAQRLNMKTGRRQRVTHCSGAGTKVVKNNMNEALHDNTLMNLIKDP